MHNNNDSIKLLLILIIISLIILGALGSVYYFTHSKVRLLYVEAKEHFNLGSTSDIRKGIQRFRVLAERYPRSKYAPRALYQIGYGYELLYKKTKDENKLDIAIKEYYRVYKDYKNSVSAENSLYQIAHINYLKREYEEAQEKLDYILSEYIDTSLKPQIYTKKGMIYLEIGEYRKALAYFNHKETLNEDMSFIGKAKCYFKLGEYEKGINALEDLLRYRPTSNYKQEAVKLFLDKCYTLAKKLASEKDYRRSNFLYDKIIELFPDNKLVENALYWKGENYYDQRKYYQGIGQFKKVLDNKLIHKDDAAYFKLGMCYFEDDKFEEALKNFQQIINYYPNSPHFERAKNWKRQSLREIKYRH